MVTKASTTDETPAGPGSASGERPAASPAPRSPVRRFFGLLGPGLVAGASDDHPSGVATYAQAGATFGTGLLWTVPLTLPLMIAVQEICDRTALATGENLGALARRKFTKDGRPSSRCCWWPWSEPIA